MSTRRSARKLNLQNYETACDLAGAALLQPVPISESLFAVSDGLVWTDVTAAVYLAADCGNTIRYVGSVVRRDPHALNDRIREHVRTGRAERWTRLMMVPLLPGIPVELARTIEGRIGLVLRPQDTIRLPSLAQARAPRARRDTDTHTEPDSHNSATS